MGYQTISLTVVSCNVLWMFFLQSDFFCKEALLQIKYAISVLLDNTFPFRKWWNWKQDVNVLDRMLLVCANYTSTFTNQFVWIWTEYFALI